jgi:hypothetical protein
VDNQRKKTSGDLLKGNDQPMFTFSKSKILS